MNNITKEDFIFYQQHYDSHRHQNSLKWNAFRMLTIIEGAVLLALFKTALISWEIRILMIVGFLLVLFLSLTTIKDQLDSRANLNVVKKFEKKHSIPYKNPKWPNFLSGFNLMLLSLIILNLFNLVLSILICIFRIKII